MTRDRRSDPTKPNRPPDRGGDACVATATDVAERAPGSQIPVVTIADHDRRVFAVEGPMTDDRPWKEAAAYTSNHYQHRIVCGPADAHPDELAADYRREHKLAGVPPGSIVRPRS